MKKSTAKKPTKSSTKRKQIIVFVDGAENYYELSRETLEKGKLSARRKREVEKLLEDRPIEFQYINNPTIPGSIMIPPFEGGKVPLHYAGFYLSGKSKR
jgi:hypothetical protein